MFSLCVIFILEVYNVVIKVYIVFFGKKWVALKRAGCCVASKEPVTVIDLDLHYKHDIVSEKISKSYNFGLTVTSGISFIK